MKSGKCNACSVDLEPVTLTKISRQTRHGIGNG